MGAVDSNVKSISASIVVPTFRRPGALRACLDGIAQLQRPDQIEDIIVVRRIHDLESAQVIRSFAPMGVTEVLVNRPGVVAAVRAGAGYACGDVVAFLDDDAVPRPDWLQTLLSHYSSENIGAVGGKDVIHNSILEDHDGSFIPVGRVSRWGRLTGNHHLGVGEPQRVDHLKGVNMSVRRDLLRFPCRLRGEGAQVYNELAICLDVKRAGWAIIYDPSVLVDHYLGERHDEDGRVIKSDLAISNSAYNLTYILSSLAPDFRLRLFLYGLFIGNRAVPGVGRALLALITGDRETFRRLIPSLRGQIAGSCDAKRSPLSMRPVSERR